MPNGAIGIIKRLTALYTKGFNGGTGTLYIALPNVLTAHLPTAPYGNNQSRVPTLPLRPAWTPCPAR